VSIEDIIKPFQTKMKVNNVSAGFAFQKYDLNNNMRLSVEELRNALKEFSGMILSE
jgi:Ca2+-binding EF-hand superfamily protein